MIDIVQAIETHVADIRPTIVYTHHAGDLNLDHRIVHQAAMTALRPLPGAPCRSIHTFEVLSSTEWGNGFAPNHFIDVSSFMTQKLEALKCYDDEMRRPPHARSYESIEDMAALRGASVGVHYAEAFMTMRSIVR
jgi:LmbE family N-acetylglucosaminyl deacetylase